MKRSMVSIILPTYNHLKYLPMAIDSALAQTYENFELIVVNDGSTDDTKQYLDSIQNPKVHVIHQKNRKLPEALNSGFQIARGDLLTWISADNYCSPVFLETFAKLMEEHPMVGFAHSAYASIDEDNRITGFLRNEDISFPKMLANNVGIASFVYRRVCQDNIGMYDSKLEGAEDWDYWLRILEKYKSVYTDAILYYYRKHSNSLSMRSKNTIIKSSREAFRKAMNRRNNTIDIREMYPAIAHCKDTTSAEFYAYFDLGTNLLNSPHADDEVTIKVLEQAILIRPDSLDIMGPLAVASARLERWQQVLILLKKMIAHAEKEKVINLCRKLAVAGQEKDPSVLSNVRLYVPNKNKIELFRIQAASTDF